MYSKREQYGSGSFFDKYTGDDNTGGSRSFDFDLTIIHKNQDDESQPYKNYHHNEGIMEFEFIYEEGDEPLTLWFKIHFFPEWHREGEIYKVVDGEKVLAGTFTHNEKTGEGETKWYNEDGEVVDEE